MKILWIGGNHRRHLYYINQISKSFELSGAVIEMRESMVPQAPHGCSLEDKELFDLHFRNREASEYKFFGEQDLPPCCRLEVAAGELNSEKTANFVREIDPDIVLIFGCELIKDPLLSALPVDSINLHLGLSPKYRGAATLFWPFYFMEPWYAGSTFHYIIAEPDAGDIIHQVVPVLQKEDKIHDVACKVVLASTEEAKGLLEHYKKNKSWKRFRQKGTGRNFLSSDFRPEHLRVIYSLFSDDIVACHISGEISGKKPKLIRQFV